MAIDTTALQQHLAQTQALIMLANQINFYGSNTQSSVGNRKVTVSIAPQDLANLNQDYSDGLAAIKQAAQVLSVAVIP